MKIIIVGGGAGGLELATYLGRKLGAKKKAEVLLIDRQPTHLWKPLLHEVAAGSLDSEVDSVSYRAHGHQNGFQFKLGEFCGLDSDRQCIQLAPLLDDEGEEILPQREEPYDQLVLAIGSVSNDFRIPGVADHCRFLDGTAQAKNFHRNLVNRFIQLNRQLKDDPAMKLRVAIVGGGATGVELTAELFNARELFNMYGLEQVTADNLDVTLIEAGPCLVPALSPRVSNAVLEEVKKLGVDVRLNTQVSSAEKGIFHTKDENKIEADILVWAAGIKVPEFITDIEGLETNRLNQILVKPTLQTTVHDNIYAIGDCAGLQLSENKWVPPRAQSAHQMASLVGKNIVKTLQNKPLDEFQYRDHGSLISLSRYTTVGVLMGNLGKGGSINLRGWLARMAYISLYRMHQVALHGWPKAILMVVADRINHIIRPRLKLH
ncbi:NAD(P)/FAD-dependent oxidoreductase [Marinibactrum halimedae]|uniref:NADH dehydrogenase n=1 Tax=Marinibactrum halimedae TaxID=1444977 RepID=A0AA37WLR0_9GAMM|nr:NAD(P)/FAD-dependent oxidoreductase [Marinibactrum halimedae]MCD9460472.1 NAD(P)/FAD-dependent oxidoreductase [Marinibactrum halimedae]GLS25878.1 NADH dehydrogenase [Marinibactrum halimedae]